MNFVVRKTVSGLLIGLGGLVATGLVACETQYDDPAYGYGIAAYQGDAGGITGDGSASAQPILVKIDPSATMVQTPGQGVGVFTQYDPTSDANPGGHWYVWWTCDTSLSGQSCPFDITVSVASGSLANVSSENFASGDVLSAPGVTVADAGGDAATNGEAGAIAGSLTAQTNTTTTVQGVRFDTAPGAVITLSAALGGEYSGSFLFFVQDGKVNGGYTGTLSDPLELQSSSP